MKTKHPNQTDSISFPAAFAKACLGTCRNLVDRINETKRALLSEFRGALGVHQQLLHSVLNEAEALAWQTEYPHLVFPGLAREKVEAAAAWHVRQRFIQRRQLAQPYA